MIGWLSAWVLSYFGVTLLFKLHVLLPGGSSWLVAGAALDRRVRGDLPLSEVPHEVRPLGRRAVIRLPSAWDSVAVHWRSWAIDCWSAPERDRSIPAMRS